MGMRSPGSKPAEARHRSNGSIEADDPLSTAFLRRLHQGNGWKKADSLVLTIPLIIDKKIVWKHFSLKLLFMILLVIAFVTILAVPMFLVGDFDQKTATAEVKQSDCSDEKLLEWLKRSEPVKSLLEKTDMKLRIGFLGLEPDFKEWEKFSGVRPTVLKLEPVHDSLTWSDFFPEWIDEEEQWEKPKCPELPQPPLPEGMKLDMVIASMPCTGSSWERDIKHLQLLLSAAKVAVQTGDHNMYIVLCGRCKPIQNLFTCKELVDQQAYLRLYRVNLGQLQKSLSLPVGSCKLSVPLKIEGTRHVNKLDGRKEAYATILHSAQFYVCGAITLAQSIRLSGSTKDLVILVDASISPEHRQGLEAAGWKVHQIERIRNPNAEPESYNEWNYSKFRLWQLVQYDKVIYVDADLLVLQNMDFLFEMPEISATGNNGSLFNSGVMVIEPSNCTFELLMENIASVYSYNGGDQGFLNEVYPWWHRLPKHMNFLKHNWSNDTEEVLHKLELFGADPPVLYAVHFLGIKPWLCFRDYDCNWNQEKLHEYAIDIAHAQWWKVHDTMPDHLQKFCLLRSKQKASLEWDRRQAEAAAYKDQHWKIKIKDPRLKVCYENFCNWESMLLHWGENATVSLN